MSNGSHSFNMNLDEAGPRIHLKSHKENYNYGKTKRAY